MLAVPPEIGCPNFILAAGVHCYMVPDLNSIFVVVHWLNLVSQSGPIEDQIDYAIAPYQTCLATLAVSTIEAASGQPSVDCLDADSEQ